MAIYSLDGNQLTNAYSLNGDLLTHAYDIEGNEILEPVVPDLTVMTYNYQWCTGINSQLTMQQAIIELYEPDIIGLQEAASNNRNSNSFPSLAPQFLDDYTYRYLSTEATNRNGIASKIQPSDLQTVKYTDNDDENWDYQKCYITVAGKQIAWFNTHLTWRNNEETKARKRLQATEFFEAVEEEEYAIVTGDFNMYDPSFDGYDYISIGKPFADAGYRLSNWNSTVGFVKTWTNATSASSLSSFIHSCDNIITTPNIRMKRVIFDTTKFSYLDGNAIDHVPVIAELKIL